MRSWIGFANFSMRTGKQRDCRRATIRSRTALVALDPDGWGTVPPTVSFSAWSARAAENWFAGAFAAFEPGPWRRQAVTAPMTRMAMRTATARLFMSWTPQEYPEARPLTFRFGRRNRRSEEHTSELQSR